jgi:hypothetical protein
MHLREAMGPPVLVIAGAARVDQLAGRALVCAALDRRGLGNAPARTLTRWLTAAAAVPARRRSRTWPRSSSASGELPESGS